MHDQSEQIEASKPKRRVLASASRVEEVIAVAQRHGITPTAVVMHPDGSTEIRFGEVTQAAPGTGWEDF